MNLEHFHADLGGWFGFKAIYDRALERLPDTARIVEVGSWMGKSAAYLAVELERRESRAEFWCVDTFKGSADATWMAPIVAAHGGSLLPIFLDNMRKGGVAERVQAIESTSVDAAARFEDESLDFVMIDAAHDYESVSADIRAWLPKVKPGGILAGDDIGSGWPEVELAVYDSLPKSEVEIVRTAAAWWYEKKRPERGEWLRPHGAGYYARELLFVPATRPSAELERCLSSLEPVRGDVVLIDQSEAGLHDSVKRHPVGHFRAPHGGMTFSQVQNWIQAEACARRLEFFFFMHDDASLCDKHVLADMLGAMRADPKLGIGLSNYDACAIFRLSAVIATGPWDESFRWYSSECDYYHRMRRRGFEVKRVVDGGRVGHVGSATLHNMNGSERGPVEQQSEWARNHYVHKWGGKPGEERFHIPYNGRP